MIEGADLFVGRRRALLKRPHYIAAKNRAAGKRYFRYRCFRLHIQHSQLAHVGVQVPHRFCNLGLTFEPFHAIRIFRLPHHHEAIANSDSIIASSVNINIFALRPVDLIAGLLAGNDVHIVGQLRIFDKSRAINR